jgi:protein-S-isoprenylcysteine O-methyltransferase Ste14
MSKMTFDPGAIIGYSWKAVGIVWLIGLIFTKRTVRAQSYGTRLFHLALLVLGIALMSSNRFRFGWLGMRFVPLTHGVLVAGCVLTVIGCAFAIWARVTLGANWSAKATVKAGHELITSGPYALARHPIYTGVLAGLTGSALAGGEGRDLLALAVFAFAFMVKMSQEERLLLQTFPDAYPLYRQRVKALIPGVF